MHELQQSTPVTRPRWERWLELVFVTPAAICLFALAAQVTLNAVGRKLFGWQIPSTLELSQFWYLPCLAAPGFVVAQLRREHIAADLVFDRFPPAARRWVGSVGYALCVVVSGGAAYFAFTVALRSMERGKTAGFSDYVIWPAEMVVSVSLAALAVLLVHGAVRAVMSDERTFIAPSESTTEMSS